MAWTTVFKTTAVRNQLDAKNGDAPIEGVADKRGDVVVSVLLKYLSTANLVPPGLLLPVCKPSLKCVVRD